MKILDWLSIDEFKRDRPPPFIIFYTRGFKRHSYGRLK